MKNVSWLIIGLLLTVNTAQARQVTYLKNASVIRDIIWASFKVNVPTDALLAICYTESHFNVQAKLTHMDGDSLSHGICQIKLGTALYMDEVFKHKVKVTAKRLELPAVNAFYAAKYFRYQLNRYKSIKLAVDAYNKHNAVSSESRYVKAFEKNLTIFKNKIIFVSDKEAITW